MSVSWGVYGGIALAAVLVVALGMTVRHWAMLREQWACWRGTHPATEAAAIMHNLAATLNHCDDYARCLTRVLSFLSDCVGTDEGSILLYCRESRRYVLREVRGARPGSFKVGDINGFLQKLQSLRRTMTRREFVNNAQLGEMKTLGLQYCVQFHAEACIPCFHGDRLIAVINLGARQHNVPYDPTLCALLNKLAAQSALAIANAILAEQSARYQKELRQATEIRSQFLANLSHELRTPLTSVIGLSEHVLEALAVGGQPSEHVGTMLVDDLRDYLTMIHESGHRLLNTVTALIDLARLESGRETLDVRRINLGKLFQEVRPDVVPSPKTVLDITLNGHTPSVYGDATWLRCLVHHLLDNAVKFTKEGRVWVDAERSGDMLKIGVHDTGIGVPQAQQSEIFAGFHQGDNGMTRSHEGTGIGLAISRRVIELHGGRIWMQSRPGNGSHFYFTLPVKPSIIGAHVAPSTGKSQRSLPLARAVRAGTTTTIARS